MKWYSIGTLEEEISKIIIKMYFMLLLQLLFGAVSMSTAGGQRKHALH